MREYIKVFVIVAGLVPIVVLAIVSMMGAAQLVIRLWHGQDDAWLAILCVVGLAEVLGYSWWGTRRRHPM
ncbi:MAG TPA: hypothetical protein VMW54_10325 [Terriglobia bacterium]|nr:hypothetical protein [Terriglobia bacterium]